MVSNHSGQTNKARESVLLRNSDVEQRLPAEAWVLGNAVAWAIILSTAVSLVSWQPRSFWSTTLGFHVQRQMRFLSEQMSAPSANAFQSRVAEVAEGIRHFRINEIDAWDIKVIAAALVAGAILGGMHWLVLRRWVDWPGKWVIAQALGAALATMSLMFLMSDSLYAPRPYWPVPIGLALAPLLVWLALRRRVRSPVAWIGTFLLGAAIVVLPTLAVLYCVDNIRAAAGWVDATGLAVASGGVSGALFGALGGALTSGTIKRLAVGKPSASEGG